MLGEEIPDSDIFFFQIPFTCFNNNKSYPFIKNYSKVLADFRGFHMDFYFGEKDSYEVGESILKALISRPGFGKNLNQNIIKWSYKLIDFAKKTSRLPLNKYSNKQLWRLYLDHDKVHTKLYTYGWLPVAVDMFHNNFTIFLKRYLYSVCESKAEAEKVFVALVSPSKNTVLAGEQTEFFEIYKTHLTELRSRRQKVSEALKNALVKHSYKWGHLGYIYAGTEPPFSAKHYLKELRDLAKTRIHPNKILQGQKNQLKQAAVKRKKLYTKLKIDAKHRRLFETATEFGLTKLVRRHAQLLDLMLMHQSLLTEIAKRLETDRFHVQFLLKDEVGVALRLGKFDRKLADSRLKNCVMVTGKDFETIYTGKTMKKLRNKLVRKIDKDISVIYGQTAQAGFARGTAKIIIRARDMKKMNEGDVLVSIATDPDIVPAMKKASAIVTEQGGVTSHAAIVARELGTPCVIGTKFATKVFKDGDLVEVDAQRGIVKKLK